MKRSLILLLVAFIMILTNCSAGDPNKPVKTGVAKNIIHINNDDFKKKVFNYDVNKTWKYEGTLPCIIDFYADWCGPCKMLAPILEEVAKEYAGKIVVYKVNTDVEKTLAQTVGVTGLPTLLFCKAKDQPRSSVGLVSKQDLVKIINEVLLTK